MEGEILDFLSITNQFYSKCLGEDDVLNSSFEQVKFIHSTQRNRIQAGYVRQFDLYIFYQEDKMIFSYGDSVLDKIEEIKRRITSVMPINSLKHVLKQFWGGYTIKHNVKYVYDRIPEKTLKSRPLTIDEYQKYYEFFMKNNSKCKDTDWLKDYFLNMVKENLCCGFFINELLVSCTDTPTVPYMRYEVQEIGINTLEGHKGNGYATDACITCAKEIIKNGKCPLWSTAIDNIASQKLAEKVGFIKFADVITITL